VATLRTFGAATTAGGEVAVQRAAPGGAAAPLSLQNLDASCGGRKVRRESEETVQGAAVSHDRYAGFGGCGVRGAAGSEAAAEPPVSAQRAASA
jgi:hypothetical protein